MPELTPGTLMLVRPSSLVRRWNSEEEHYTSRLQNVIVIQRSHQWREDASDREVFPDYLVLFSNDGRMYLVSAGHLVTPDQARDPSRLFGRLSG